MAQAPNYLDIANTLRTLVDGNFKQVVRYMNENYTIVATMPIKPRKNERGITVSLTFGKPNYAAREVLKKLKKSSISLPKMGWTQVKRHKENA